MNNSWIVGGYHPQDSYFNGFYLGLRGNSFTMAADHLGRFGWAVSMSRNGQVVAIGARNGPSASLSHKWGSAVIALTGAAFDL